MVFSAYPRRDYDNNLWLCHVNSCLSQRLVHHTAIELKLLTALWNRQQKFTLQSFLISMFIQQCSYSNTWLLELLYECLDGLMSFSRICRLLDCLFSWRSSCWMLDHCRWYLDFINILCGCWLYHSNFFTASVHLLSRSWRDETRDVSLQIFGTTCRPRAVASSDTTRHIFWVWSLCRSALIFIHLTLKELLSRNFVNAVLF